MTDYLQDELDLFSDPAAKSLPLCLYRSRARGLAGRVAEFEAWKREHGSLGSLLRSHAWTAGADMPSAPTDRCQAAVIHVDLRPHRDTGNLGLTCSCLSADAYLYRGACRGCTWEGVSRSGLSAENPAAEDALDHGWPGWRELPAVNRRPDDKKAAARWLARVTTEYPAGWLEAGGPIRTWRSGFGGGRHVPGYGPFGGYDVGVPSGQEAS